MNPVEDFIYHYEGEQRKLLLFLHHILTIDFGLEAKIRYKIPFYYGRSWICYLNPIKEEGVELAFIRGHELSNEQGLLDSKGRKQVSGVSWKSTKEIPVEVLQEILHEAMLLDETVPYKLNRKKK